MSTLTDGQDVQIPATDVVPGMHYRSLGSGYISREITAVDRGCPCTYGVRSIDQDKTHTCRDMVTLTAAHENFRQHVTPSSLVTVVWRSS
jgi:hypothetical protein